MANDANTRKVILLVDDDEVFLSITEATLKDEYDVLMAKSGKEAIELLGKNQTIPDLILLDILMPEMDGWEVYDKINDIAALKLTPIMFYTTLDEDSAREKAYELGAFDFLTKPCKKQVLLEKIKDALRKAELQKQQQGI